MDTQKRETWLRKTAAASILPFAALGLAGCSGDTAGTEESADVEDVQEQPPEEAPVEEESAADEEIYDGVYDTAFYEDYNSYVGETVTVSAEVDRIISDMAFTIAGTDDTTVDPLLIVHEGQVQELQPGLAVAVTGTVKEGFDLAAVEEESGWDLDDEAFDEMDTNNYIMATNIDTSVDADAEEEENSEE